MTASLSTHVLDTALGVPARGVPVSLHAREGAAWSLLGSGETDADGRHRGLVPAGAALSPGVYRITFDTAAYAEKTGTETFFPEVSIVFEIKDASHYHVPLLLSPFGYSTYRGS